MTLMQICAAESTAWAETLHSASGPDGMKAEVFSFVFPVSAASALSALLALRF